MWNKINYGFYCLNVVFGVKIERGFIKKIVFRVILMKKLGNRYVEKIGNMGNNS